MRWPEPGGTRLALATVVKMLIEQLLSLQTLQLGSARGQANREQNIAALRKQVPSPILLQFDRWLARGRKAVAVVRHGACSECHLTLPIGTITAAAFGPELEHCGNCGRFLYLPENEPVYAAAPPKAEPTPKATRRKTADAHAAR